jgi:molybdopterin/thiamine biosynthesis adenylyltransferase
MTTLREAAEVALAVLEEINKLSLAPGGIALPGKIDTAMDLIREAIVPSDCSDSHQPDAWMTEARNDLGLPVFFCASEVKQAGPGLIPLYTAPPQREWQELTNEEIDWIKGSANRAIGYIRVTAAKLKEKNT